MQFIFNGFRDNFTIIGIRRWRSVSTPTLGHHCASESSVNYDQHQPPPMMQTPLRRRRVACESGQAPQSVQMIPCEIKSRERFDFTTQQNPPVLALGTIPSAYFFR
jgi:hypothetical protein